MFLYGLLVSWFYLRFVQKHPNGVRGDHSPSFAFHTFFPNVLQPLVKMVANTIYAGLAAIRLCPASLSSGGRNEGDTAATYRLLSERLSEESRNLANGQQSSSQGRVQNLWFVKKTFATVYIWTDKKLKPKI